MAPPFLLELPADDPERARRFWEKLLGTTLEERGPDEGQGWQAEHEGIVFGLHERGRGPGPGDRFALPYFAVPDLPAALDLVRAPVARSSTRVSAAQSAATPRGTPFGLAAHSRDARDGERDAADDETPEAEPA